METPTPLALLISKSGGSRPLNPARIDAYGHWCCSLKNRRQLDVLPMYCSAVEYHPCSVLMSPNLSELTYIYLLPA